LVRVPARVEPVERRMSVRLREPTRAPLTAPGRYGCLLWEETSRKIFPSYPIFLFGRRAFASSLAMAAQVACARARRLTKMPIATRDVSLSESRTMVCNPPWTLKPSCSLAEKAGTILLSGPLGPRLRSALRRGITCPWGLRAVPRRRGKPRPETVWMLSSDSDSSVGCCANRPRESDDGRRCTRRDKL
jgi:hypothetical protein